MPKLLTGISYLVGVPITLFALAYGNCLIFPQLPLCGTIERSVNWALVEIGIKQRPRPPIREFTCKENALPKFTLGRNSSPSDADIAKLCKCVWGKLSDEARITARFSRKNESSKVSGEQIGRFITEMRRTMRECGAFDL